MKKLLIFLLLLCSGAYAQKFSGTVIDAATQQPLPYVNIGVVGKGLGTVSDINGKFSILLPDSVNSQELRMSCIGYKPWNQKVSAFKENTGEHLVRLNAATVALKEVTVRPRKLVQKTLGNTNSNSSIMLGFATNDLGSELGTIMHVKGRLTYLESMAFNLAANKIDTVKFRVNVYSIRDGQPDSLLLRTPVYVTTTQKKGKVTVNLADQNIATDKDFLVSLEWIEDYPTRDLWFCGAIMQANSLYRKTSQDKWKRTVGVSISAEVKSVKN